MRLLFTLDMKDYDGCTKKFVRDSARSIIIRDGKVAMVHSLMFDHYKFPGGGIEKGEDPVDAMIRETREEAGLAVIPGTIREYGYVHRTQRSNRDSNTRYVQDNYYYFCEVADEPIGQDLDDYEAEEQYRLEYIDPAVAIQKNRTVDAPAFNRVMLEREALVLELLIAEGYLS